MELMQYCISSHLLRKVFLTKITPPNIICSSLSSHHLHDEVTTHETLLSRLLETRVLWGRRDTGFSEFSESFVLTVQAAEHARTRFNLNIIYRRCCCSLKRHVHSAVSILFNRYFILMPVQSLFFWRRVLMFYLHYPETVYPVGHWASLSSSSKPTEQADNEGDHLQLTSTSGSWPHDLGELVEEMWLPGGGGRWWAACPLTSPLQIYHLPAPPPAPKTPLGW